jgi:hypothetical protein
MARGCGHEDLISDGRPPPRTEDGSRKTCTLGNLCQATSSETIADGDIFVLAVVNCKECELAIALSFLVATVCKSPVNLFNTPSPSLVTKYMTIMLRVT